MTICKIKLQKKFFMKELLFAQDSTLKDNLHGKEVKCRTGIDLIEVNYSKLLKKVSIFAI